MRRLLGLALALCMVGVGTALTAAPAQSAPPRFSSLSPGGQPDLAERVTVNVVFVGYDRTAVNFSSLRSGLPRTYEPVVRSRLPYGITEKLGIRYSYDYRVTVADRAYEDRFFGQLRRLGRRAPLTAFQTEYNAQRTNARDVTENYEIDAPTVERWLAYHPPAGVDTRRNTVFLVNGFERPDFRFHVYTKTDEPDPDTGYNFGVERSSRKITAWGGTTARDEENGLGSTRRVWFHDISAGPESSGGSWNVDDADLDGDKEPDYRIPPIWEYGRYRPASALTGDLVRILRYVALDLLFTTSPLYPVELPSQLQPRRINIDANTYEGWPGVNASARFTDPTLITAELQELLRFKRLDYDNQDFPFTGQARRCYIGIYLNRPCYSELDYPAFANLYLYNRTNLRRTKDDGRSVDYELPVFNYAVDNEETIALGFADDNYRDGTQSFVFNFVSPDIVEAGYGLSTTTIHEVGHHVGLSHPHDGYDSASGVDFTPSGSTYFAWLGDYSNSMMSYIDLNWDFSQFDADNLDRFRAAAAIEGANTLAAAALRAPRPDRATPALLAADRAVGLAEAAFRRHEYVAALAAATSAYYLAVAAVDAAGGSFAAAEADTRLAARAARAAEPAHEAGLFVDTLDGPRGAE